jgi:hypothetical protein
MLYPGAGQKLPGEETMGKLPSLQPNGASL